MKRILRHVGAKDFRKTHQRKLDEQRALYLEERERQIQQLEEAIILKELSEPYKSDWRSDLFEGMTTSGLLGIPLPATGDVEYLPTESEKNSFTLGPFTSVSGVFDTSRYDTMIVDVEIYDAGFVVLDADQNALLVAFDSGTYSFRIPQGKNQLFYFVGPDDPVEPLVFSITDIRFQRRTPLNVLVSLDSPEATNFIRTDPIMQGLSAEDRRKKLEDMLNAGDEYLLKQLGIQGSTARPADTGNIQSWEQAAQEAYEVAQQKYQQDLAAYEKALAAHEQKSAELSKAVDAARAEYLKSGQTVAQRQQSYSKLQAAIKAGTDHALSTLRNPITKPTPPSTSPTQSQPQQKLTPQQLADIDKQIKDLQAQSEKSKQDAQNNRWKAAGELALGVAGVVGGVGALAKIPAAVRAARAGSQVVKTGAGSPGARAFAKANPGKYNPFLSDKVNRYLRNSHEPQGQVISEKKLKFPKEVLNNKIPGYYDGKPAPLGFPDNPPPEMVNGMHPDLVDGKKVADRFNRLDPVSAKAMPLTGNPHIDKKVKAARKKPK